MLEQPLSTLMQELSINNQLANVICVALLCGGMGTILGYGWGSETKRQRCPKTEAKDVELPPFLQDEHYIAA